MPRGVIHDPTNSRTGHNGKRKEDGPQAQAPSPSEWTKGVDRVGMVFCERVYLWISLWLLPFFGSLELVDLASSLTNSFRFIFIIMAGNPCMALLWIFLLIFIAWPLAFFASGLWIFLQPFEACFSCLQDCNQCLEGFVTWPRAVGEAISSCDSSCPKPNY